MKGDSRHCEYMASLSKSKKSGNVLYLLFVKRNIKEGPTAWNATRRFVDWCNSVGLIKHFDVLYKPNTIPAILRYAEEFVDVVIIIRCPMSFVLCALSVPSLLMALVAILFSLSSSCLLDMIS